MSSFREAYSDQIKTRTRIYIIFTPFLKNNANKMHMDEKQTSIATQI